MCVDVIRCGDSLRLLYGGIKILITFALRIFFLSKYQPHAIPWKWMNMFWNEMEK